MPRLAEHPFLHHVGPIPLVHRGGPSDYPENSMSAFDHSYQLGFRYFETDVQVTADGVVVAHHDLTVKGSGAARLRIKDLTVKELHAQEFGAATSPRLEEILSAFPDARVNIDPKTDVTVRPLATVLQRADALARVCCGSFSDRRLRWLRTALGEDLCTSASPREVAAFRWSMSDRRPRGGSVAASSNGPHLLQVPRSLGPVPLVTAAFVDQAHEVGLPVQVWTINSTQHANQLLDLGVDGLMSDDPEMLRQVFVERDLWPRPLAR